MELSPTISIICITYNHEKYIEEAIKGFLIQKTSHSFEIIIHDDASTDNTANIIRKYEKKHPTIIKPIYQSENQYKKRGVVTKTVFAAAKGKYIAFCEGDDYWTDPLKLQKQLDFLTLNEKYSGSFHETQVIFSNGEMGKIYGEDASNIVTAEDTLSLTSPFHTSSFIFKKECIRNIPNWFTKVVSGDMALFSIVSKYGPFKKIPEVMSVYRKHSEGITSSKQVVDTFHQKRIELIQFLNGYHEFKYNKKAKEIIAFHRNKIGLDDNLIPYRRLRNYVIKKLSAFKFHISR